MPDKALAKLATDVLLLLHVPPVMPSDKVVQPPSHTCASPPMDEGAGLTVTVTVLVQPNPNEYVITVVPLAVGALQTCPVLPTTATNVLLLVQVPPVGLSDNSVHWPAHTCGTPEIGKGAVFTVTMAVAEQPAPVV